jgi:hypothetical protein
VVGQPGGYPLGEGGPVVRRDAERREGEAEQAAGGEQVVGVAVAQVAGRRLGLLSRERSRALVRKGAVPCCASGSRAA